MQLAQKVTHLVHIGFDKRNQIGLESRIEKYIQTISDQSDHIINFVDESSYTPKQGKIIQKTMFADHIAIFANLYGRESDDLIGEIDTLMYEKWTPKALLDFMKSEFDKKYQKLKEYGSIMNDFINQEDILLNPTKQFLEARKNYESLINLFMWERFEEMLFKTQKKFEGQNIFNLRLNEEIRNDNVKNIERKLRVVELAEKYLGKQRIMFSTMRELDFDKISAILELEEYKKRFLDSSIITKQEHEKEYWNATDSILKENRNLTIDRTKKNKKMYQNSIKKIWFELDNETDHIVGGEYIWRCAASWCNFLLIYGTPKNNINQNPKIWIFHPKDK